jgi:predicted PurR-regulated permease PerM
MLLAANLGDVSYLALAAAIFLTTLGWIVIGEWLDRSGVKRGWVILGAFVVYILVATLVVRYMATHSS